MALEEIHLNVDHIFTFAESLQRILTKSTPAWQTIAEFVLSKNAQFCLSIEFLKNRQLENLLWKILVGDKLRAMKLPARLLMAALVLSIGPLTPVLSREMSLSTPHETNCCADMKRGGCHSCPTDTAATHSGLASTCCTAQSMCCALYFTKAKAFVTPMQLIGTVGLSDERASARAQRPPVPPPRSVIS